MPVESIRNGFRTVTPYLVVPGAAELLGFLAQAFGAEEKCRFGRPDGTVMHAEVQIGDSMVMLGEPKDEFGPMPASIYLYVENCDEVYERAVQAGGTSVMEPTNMTHAGERYGGVKDPSGNIWWVATHIEDISPEEEARRIEAMEENGPGGE